MSTATALSKKWEGRMVDRKFPLRRWLGGSDHSVVFLTERGGGAQKAAIKLIPAQNLKQENLDETAQLSRWAGAARLSRPHLIRLFEWGRWQFDNTRLMYVVMEYAEENLAEILPVRALTADEAREMLRPIAEALASLHQASFVHGHIRPSNILAVNDTLKISADGLGKIGDPADERLPSAYDAPEIAAVGLTSTADIWSLGVTLIAVLTQKEPELKSGERRPVAVPETIPQPFRDIAKKCLQADPKLRGSANDILSKLGSSPVEVQTSRVQTPRETEVVAADVPLVRSKRWVVLPIVVAAVMLVTLLALKFMSRRPAVPAAETHTSKAPIETPAAQLPAPFSENKKPTQKGIVRGSVLQQVLPDVSRSALNTITGRIKVSVQVEVDASGNVSQSRLVSPGSSLYFANHAVAAARGWKFVPPRVDGTAGASEWLLRFQFARSGTQVSPTETKP
jgi:TonB family protein